MNKVVIIGGGIAGLTAGILLQKAGYQTEIYEKNSIAGGLCTGWKRDEYTIDNCIHWLTGSKEGSGLYDLWKEIGALGDGVDTYEKQMFFSSKSGNDVVTYWRDKEKTRDELLALSPEDKDEINKLIDYVSLAEGMTVPVDKPFDAMHLSDFIKLGKSMKGMSKLMKEYGNMDITELANRFKHPLIRRSITDYVPAGNQAYTFLVCYAAITGGDGKIPKGGSLAMAMRIADRYKELGGVIDMNAPVERVVLRGNRATGITLQNGTNVDADYVICACDTSYTFEKLIPAEYMPKKLAKLYKEREKYLVNSAFQIAYAVDGKLPDLEEIRIFTCDELHIGAGSTKQMYIQSYDYEKDFAPEGKTVLQSNFAQSQEDYDYWEKLYQDKEAYNSKKQEIAEEALERLVKEYPMLEGKVRILDVWTPMTYKRYCHSYKGSYMSFVVKKGASNIRVPGVIKGLNNVYLASEWLMGPGGLPTAAAMGKFAAWRIINK